MELFRGIRAFEHARWGFLASECYGYFLGADNLRLEHVF
jgi:hypothetical protein